MGYQFSPQCLSRNLDICNCHEQFYFNVKEGHESFRKYHASVSSALSYQNAEATHSMIFLYQMHVKADCNR